MLGLGGVGLLTDTEINGADGRRYLGRMSADVSVSAVLQS